MYQFQHPSVYHARPWPPVTAWFWGEAMSSAYEAEVLTPRLTTYLLDWWDRRPRYGT